MAADGSVTRQIRDLEEGRRREDAARELWDRFFGELVSHALRKLHALHAMRSVADEEDAAARAFTKICRGIESGQLKLEGRADLHKLLLKATTRAAIDQSRGVGRAAGGSVLAQVPDEVPRPELLVMAQEGFRRLIDILDDDLLRQIALWKLVGHTNEEIAHRLGRAVTTVEFKLKRIRTKWAAVVPDLSARPGPR